ncbi:MAG: hypothetical protein BWY75_03348 [bacterium ADurb.Bin425]|nr:MAG: hypothetical protein BWY75_03348 [bacterium ADurb.Bin425]
MAGARVGAYVFENAAYDDARVKTAAHHYLTDHGRGGGFAVGACYRYQFLAAGQIVEHV